MWDTKEALGEAPNTHAHSAPATEFGWGDGRIGEVAGGGETGNHQVAYSAR